MKSPKRPAAFFETNKDFFITSIAPEKFLISQCLVAFLSQFYTEE